MKFGLIFFSSSETTFSDEKYRLVIESAKFADQNGLSSIWVPERHFTRDGWLYPNPAVLQAALARETKRIGLRAGSVVMPLHNPIRVVEEWAMVDNLSNGRVGISFASGWHSNDFVFFPEKYANRRQEMERGVETVRKLWRGESIKVKGGDGNETEIKVFPTPIQATLPVWLTAAGNPLTFVKAGELGVNLLTHMFNQSIEELAGRIKIYRESRSRHGHDAMAGQVTLMLHTFIGMTDDAGHPQVRARFCEYLKSASYLLDAIAVSRGQKVDFASLSEADLNDYLNFVFDRLVTNERVLFGTPQTCADIVARLAAIGVDEVACQLDFGMDAEWVLESLPYLNQLKTECESASFLGRVAELVPPQGVTSLAAGRPRARVEVQYEEESGLRPPDPLDQIRARCSEKIAVEDFYQRLRRIGIQRAGRVRGIESIQRCDGEALARIRLLDPGSQEGSFYFRQAFLDAALQVMAAALPAEALTGAEEPLYLFAGLRRFELRGQPQGSLWSLASLRSNGARPGDAFEGDVRLLDETGRVLVELLGLKLRRMEGIWQSSPGDQSSALQVVPEAPAAVARRDLLAVGGEERRRLLELYLQEKVASAFRLPLSRVGLHEPLNGMGLDSLIAIELKRRVEADLGVNLRIVLFLLGHSIAQMAALIAEQLGGAEPPEPPLISQRSAEEWLSRLDELSDAEVDSLLGGMLTGQEVKA